MHSANNPEVMWGLGLDPDTAAFVENSAGPGFTLRNLPPDAAPWMRGTGGDSSRVAWVPWRVWNTLPRLRRADCRKDDSVRRILLLDEKSEPLEMEQVLEEGFLTAVRAPLTRYKVRDALFRVRELESLSTDLKRKTEEILLERELLARKSDHLTFLNRVLTRASSSLDVTTILGKARNDLRQLLPVEHLSAVFWRREPGVEGLVAEIYMHCRMTPPVHAQWTETLLEAASRMGGAPVTEYRQICLSPARHMRDVPAPSAGRVLMLPLSVIDEGFGCLALMGEKNLRLAKDEVQTLTAAVNHLALALRNALLFRQVKSMADRDGLTKIANRRSLEERLVDEVGRHRRYGHPLSVFMLDVDHFKRVNDTYGHPAGDIVLRDIATVLRDSLRTSDFPARFGGEEFVVLLPHTGRDQAAFLAERIRERIAGHAFQVDEHTSISATVSLGVAALEKGEKGEKGEPEADLIKLADQALYLAKHGGRNRIVVANGQNLPPELAENPAPAQNDQAAKAAS